MAAEEGETVVIEFPIIEGDAEKELINKMDDLMRAAVELQTLICSSVWGRWALKIRSENPGAEIAEPEFQILAAHTIAIKLLGMTAKTHPEQTFRSIMSAMTQWGMLKPADDFVPQLETGAEC